MRSLTTTIRTASPWLAAGMRRRVPCQPGDPPYAGHCQRNNCYDEEANTSVLLILPTAKWEILTRIRVMYSNIYMDLGDIYPRCK